ncbi:hypothetical protein SUGI_1098460 [Cryptomeria japonica]|nr:hypothetical protein SUGI_1098460 [Cryptomeria japonica]
MIPNISSLLVSLDSLYATFGMFLSCVHFPYSMTNSLGLSLMVEGSKVFIGFFSLTGRSSGVVGIESKSSVNYEYISLGCDELMVEGSKVFIGFFSLTGRSSGVVGIESKSSVNYEYISLGCDYEYISLGCDELPVLKGRTPVQCYEDFMRSFKESFQDLLGETIVEVQLGMGPAGELTYPSYPEANGTWRFPGIGAFQCYDKFMKASLKVAAKAKGKEQWDYGGPSDAGNHNNWLESIYSFSSVMVAVKLIWELRPTETNQIHEYMLKKATLAPEFSTMTDNQDASQPVTAEVEDQANAITVTSIEHFQAEEMIGDKATLAPELSPMTHNQDASQPVTAEVEDHANAITVTSIEHFQAEEMIGDVHESHLNLDVTPPIARTSAELRPHTEPTFRSATKLGVPNADVANMDHEMRNNLIIN